MPLLLRKIVTFFFMVPFILKAQSSLEISLSIKDYNCTPGSVKINVSGGTSPYYYNWTNGNSESSYSDLEIGTYHVNIADNAGEDTSITFTIEKGDCKVSIAKTFSPNGDDLYDTWGIGNIKYYPDFTLEVFNSWGQLVHSQSKEYSPWDGKHLGIEVPIGTYYYIFYYSGKSGDKEAGTVVIMR